MLSATLARSVAPRQERASNRLLGDKSTHPGQSQTQAAECMAVHRFPGNSRHSGHEHSESEGMASVRARPTVSADHGNHIELLSPEADPGRPYRETIRVHGLSDRSHNIARPNPFSASSFPRAVQLASREMSTLCVQALIFVAHTRPLTGRIFWNPATPMRSADTWRCLSRELVFSQKEAPETQSESCGAVHCGAQLRSPSVGR